MSHYPIVMFGPVHLPPILPVNPILYAVLRQLHTILAFADSLTRPELSERELQVLKYMAAGKSNKEIAQVIYVTEHTVKAHVKSILAKLGSIGRTEAIAIAIKRGIIEER